MTYLVRGWPVEWDTVQNNRFYKENGLAGANQNDLRQARTMSFSNHTDKDSIIAACTPFLVEDIKRLQPKQLLLMGNTVLAALFPREHRSLYEIAKANLTYLGIPVKVIPNPTMILRNPSARPGWEKQLKIALFGDSGYNTSSTIATSHNILKTVPEVKDYIDTLMNTSCEVAVDTETSGLQKRYGNLLGMAQFATTVENGVVIPYLHPETPFGPDELPKIKEMLFRLFSQPSKITRWVCHNAKFECNILRTAVGTQILSAPIYDTQAGAFLLDENRTARAAEFKYGIYTLKQLAIDYLGFDGYDKGVLATRAEGNLWDLPLPVLAEYGAIDASVTLALMHAEIEEAKRQNYSAQLLNLMFYFYSPIIQLFSDIEYNGSPVNLQNLRNLISSKSPLLTEIAEIVGTLKKNPIVQRVNDRLLTESNKVGGGRVFPLGGKPWMFDFAKKDHPQALFFNEMGLRVGRRSEKTGMASVDDEWQKANINNELVAKYATWIELRKMYDSFAKSIYDYVDPVSGDIDCKTDSRVRPNYMLSSVVTGRIACRKPNLQAIPRADSPAKTAIKNIFQALPGHVMVQLDYKANEIRWVGILAQDKTLAQAINAGEAAMLEYRSNPSQELLDRAEILSDIHKQVGSMIFGIPIEKVTKKERQISKSVAFGILYDSTIWSIAEAQGKSEDEVAMWFELYFAKFPDVKVWKEKMKSMAREKGYVETPHGRRRRFPIFNLYRSDSGYFDISRVPHDFKSVVNDALRQSSNAPVQGTASDASMLGSALFQEKVREHNMPVLVQNAVHDSCLYQCPIGFVKESLAVAEDCFVRGVMEHMTQVWDINFLLPIAIDLELGSVWGSMHKINAAVDFELDPVLEKVKEELKTIYG